VPYFNKKTVAAEKYIGATVLSYFSRGETLVDYWRVPA
jgi:hypothetical protein